MFFPYLLPTRNIGCSLNKNKKLQLLKIEPEESNKKICKVIGKKVLKNKKVQLNLFDGRNILVKEDKFSVGIVSW